MAKNMTDEKLDELVKYFLSRHVGKENRIERWDLVEKVFGVRVPEFERNDGHSLDRDIRNSVSRLRVQGHLICDLGDGQGRWLAANDAEFWEFYSYYVAPIKARGEVAKAMKRAAREQFPNLLQPSLFDDILEAL